MKPFVASIIVILQIYLVNLSEKDYIRKKNKWLAKIKAWVDENDPSAVLIPFSGVFELKVKSVGVDGFLSIEQQAIHVGVGALGVVFLKASTL